MVIYQNLAGQKKKLENQDMSCQIRTSGHPTPAQNSEGSIRNQRTYRATHYFPKYKLRWISLFSPNLMTSSGLCFPKMRTFPDLGDGGPKSLCRRVFYGRPHICVTVRTFMNIRDHYFSSHPIEQRSQDFCTPEKSYRFRPMGLNPRPRAY